MGPVKYLVAVALFSFTAMGSAHAAGGPVSTKPATFKQFRKTNLRQLKRDQAILSLDKPGSMEHQPDSSTVAHDKGLLRMTKADYVRDQKQSQRASKALEAATRKAQERQKNGTLDSWLKIEEARLFPNGL